MTKKTIGLGIATITVAGALAAGSVSAYRGDPNVKGPNYTPERHEAMLKAFENKDFNAWKELKQGHGRPAEVIDNQEKFERFVEMRQYMLEGKEDEAAKIRAELGLGQGMTQGYNKDHAGQKMMGHGPYAK